TRPSCSGSTAGRSPGPTGTVGSCAGCPEPPPPLRAPDRSSPQTGRSAHRSPANVRMPRDGRCNGRRRGQDGSMANAEAHTDTEQARATYDAAYRRSLEDPEGFWLEAAQRVDWFRKPTRALDDTTPPFYRWFPDGVLNTCYNALDRHVIAGHGDRVALIHDSPVTGSTARLTYAELLEKVAAFGGVLRSLGVGKGDRVVLSMPMIPEAVIAMLACARIGAVHSVVFGGFASQELAVRIDDAQPTVVVSASCGI